MKDNYIVVPDLPESVSDAIIAKWHKKEGDLVLCNEIILDIETDKVMIEVSSPFSGKLHTILKKEGSIVQSQQKIGQITNNNIVNKKKYKDVKNNHIVKDINKNTSNTNNFDNKISFTPSIRRLIKLHNLDYKSIKHSYINSNSIRRNLFDKTKKEENNNLSNKIVNTSINTDTQQINKVPMTRIRQKISERLLETVKNTAMLTTFNEVNMQPIILLRQKYGSLFKKKHDIRIGFMSFYVKAVVEALKNFPDINASIDNQDIIYYKNFDISIAISTPRGLITPVLKDANDMSMPEIEKKIKEFSIKGLENKISLKELIGGNFTITNGGVFGSLMSTPIINPPQTAILGMHAIKERPMVVDGKIVILPMMYLALSYNHCLIDGKEAISFLVLIKNILEDFNRILLDV